MRWLLLLPSFYKWSNNLREFKRFTWSHTASMVDGYFDRSLHRYLSFCMFSESVTLWFLPLKNQTYVSSLWTGLLMTTSPNRVWLMFQYLASVSGTKKAMWLLPWSLECSCLEPWAAMWEVWLPWGFHTVKKPNSQRGHVWMLWLAIWVFESFHVQ